MIEILSVDNMRRSDAKTIESGVSGRELMMRAARAVYESWKREYGEQCPAGVVESKAAIVCGSGNNAGDGYALSLLLDEDGIDCTVFCVYDRFSEDGRYYYDKCVDAGIRTVMLNGEVPDLGGYDTVFDCLLGTGFKGEVRDDLARVIEAVNASDAYVVSVDINSGLNGDNGMTSLCVHSSLTVSVGGFKSGHFLNMAKDVMKKKVNADIGIRAIDSPYIMPEGQDISKWLGVRQNFSHKGTYGYIALIGGSTRYSGAIRLAYLANAAMRSGAGVVKVALPSSIVSDVAKHILESTIFPLSEENAGDSDRCDKRIRYVAGETDELISNVRTVAFGMGIGTNDGAAKVLDHLLSVYEGTLIIDADGLTLLSLMDRKMIRKSRCRIVLTPHIKEMSRLTGLDIPSIQEDPIGTAKTYAADTGTVVLLKGPSTVITDGERVFITDRGCAGMATAGSGDVLSGILSAICSKEGPIEDGRIPCCTTSARSTKSNLNARVSYACSKEGPIEDGRISDILCLVAAGAYINGAAGELASAEYGDISMIASDTVAAIPRVLQSLSGIAVTK